jgi:hypothetical protein
MYIIFLIIAAAFFVHQNSRINHLEELIKKNLKPSPLPETKPVSNDNVSQSVAQPSVPVVASNIPPYSDFIEDEIDGYLARRDGMWLSCIESIIEKKEIEKQTMVDAMRKKIVGQYDLSKNIHMWADFYKSL